MHASVLSEDGSAAALTSTVNLYFGSQVMDPETGIILNDQMDDFSTPGSPNAFGLAPSPYNYIQPNKRPQSSAVPIIMEKDSKVVIVSGASGGSRITTSTLQTLLNVLEFGMDVGSATAAPRFHHQLIPNEVGYIFQMLNQNVLNQTFFRLK
jgi:gamma-glutamyltranspeptidase / glutathione hydrolase / leukotriene-C4 hydrolase